MAQSSVRFIHEARVSPKTQALYADVLSLFIVYLVSGSDSVEETPEGDLLLQAGWETYYGGAFDNFIDYFLPRKVLGSATLASKAPAVLRKWVQWSFENGYLDKERYEDFLLAVPVSKGREAKRLQKATNLLDKLHAMTPEALLLNLSDKLIPIQDVREPDGVVEGYMQVKRLEDEVGYVQDEDGAEIGPVFFGKALVEVLKVGDVLSIEVARYGTQWLVLESGSVCTHSQWLGL
jgi:hypothetical protein